MPPSSPPTRPKLRLRALLAIAPLALAPSCSALLGPGGSASAADEAPPELAARRFGRWTCGAELPWGRPSSVFELLRRLGPGKAWNLEIDADGLAQLQVVGHHGRARQGCWAELSAGELATLEKNVRGAGLCERPDDPRSPARAADTQSAFDIDSHFERATCTRHLTAASLTRSPAGRRFADNLGGWLDRVSNGSFQKVEAFATATRPAPARPVPGASNRRGRGDRDGTGDGDGARLTCARERQTIYGPGDSWLLDYSFQKGLLWRRDIEISAGGAVALDLASLQGTAQLACTGRLTAGELGALRDMLASSKPCDIPTGEPRLGEDRGYVSVNGDATLCRFRPLRQEDLAGSWDGRSFDRAVTKLVSSLAGPGGVDPFDPKVGLLFENHRRDRGRGGRKSAASGAATGVALR